MKKNEKFLLQKIGNYDLYGKTLGKGAFARVELANHRLTNTKVALKIIDLDQVKEFYVRKNVLRESTILKYLRHDNIVRLYETMAYRHTCCFATEYLDGDDLQTYIQKQRYLPEKQARKFFLQLLSAVQYLHWKGIMHRDLKLQNIMLTDNMKKLKLIDFGLSNYFNKEKGLTTHCGSAEYAAPELFDKETSYGPSVEIWSMGVVLFAMTTGRLPFRVESKEKKESFIVQICRGLNLSHESVIKKLTPDLKNLLSKMLEPDRDKRIELSYIMLHPWSSEKGRHPVIPPSPDVTSPEVRQKVIGRVSEIYSQPLDVTVEHLRSNSHDSIDATFNILLDKTKRAKCFSSKATSVPSILLQKLHIKSCCSNGDNTSCNGDCRRKWNRNLASSEAKYKFVADDTTSEVHPVSSCLKILKKSTCSLSKKQIKTPPYLHFEASDTEMTQTPFRLSPPVRSNYQRDHFFQHKSSKERQSNLIETTLEGVFEVNSNPSEGLTQKTEVQVESNQIKVSFSGDSLKGGSFKITEKTKQPGEALTRGHPLTGGKRSRTKSSRCVSPFEARQMLHRDTFPLRKTSVKPTNTPKRSEHKQCFRKQELNKTNSTTRKVSETKRNIYEENIQNKIMAKIVSSPDSLVSMMQSNWDSTLRRPHTRCTTQNAEDILKHESLMKKSTWTNEKICSRPLSNERRVFFKK